MFADVSVKIPCLATAQIASSLLQATSKLWFYGRAFLAAGPFVHRLAL
jgi:hypothetical protein